MECFFKFIAAKNKPAKMLKATTIQRGGRHTIKTIRNTLQKNFYRTNLSDVSICIILTVRI